MRIKILLTIAIFFSLTIVNAQINSGDIFLGGSASFFSNKSFPAQTGGSSLTKNEVLAITLQVGKVVKNNVVFGLVGSYGYNNFYYGNTDSDYAKINRFSAGVFYRKYKMLLKNFYFFGEGDAVFTHGNTKSVNYYNFSDVSKSVMNGGTISFIPGISYKACKTLYVELLMPNILSVSYSHFKSTDMQGTPAIVTTQHGHSLYGNANVDANFLGNLAIGFKFIFG